MANKKISELESRASLSLSDLMAVGDPSTGYLYKTTISDLKTLTGAGVVSFNGRFGTVNPAEGDYTLTQLGDVIITSPSNTQLLQYNGSNWVNWTPNYVTAQSGTANYIAKWGASSVLADSVIYETGGNISIGSNNPFGYKLNVQGTMRIAAPNDGQILFGNQGNSYPGISLNGSLNTQDYNFTSNSSDKTLYINTPTGYGIRFLQNNESKMFLAATGNLLINTSTDSGYKLAVNGGLRASLSAGHFVELDHANYRYLVNISNTQTLQDSENISFTVNGTGIIAFQTALVNRFVVNNSGTITISSLSGSGSRMVVADANGVLSTQAIPSTSGFVTLDTTQTITALKTFTNVVTFNQNIVGGLIKLSQGVLLSKSANIGSDPGFLSLIATSSTGLNTINIADGDNTSFTQKLIIPNTGNYNYTFPASSGTLALVSQIPSVAGVYLPLSGGTLTGALNGTSASFSSTVTATGSIQSNDVNAYLLNQAGNSTDNKLWSIQNLPSSGQFRIRALNDGMTNGVNAIVISRSGLSVVSVDFGGDLNLSSSNAMITANNMIIAGTNRKIQVWNNVSAYIDVLNFAATGAATFSSSVTATQFIVGSATTSTDVSIRFKADTGDFSLITDRGSHAFGIYDHQVSSYRMYINSAGRIGIGTTSQVGYASDDLVMQIHNTVGGGSATRSMIRLTNSVSGTAFGNGSWIGIDSTLDFYIVNSNAAAIQFQTQGLERMRITSGGAINIKDGTLTGGGGFEFTSEAFFGARFQSNAYKFMAGNNSSEFMRITSGGRVGIGTTDVDAKFKVYSDSETNLMLATVSKSSVNIVAQKQGVGYTDLDIDANVIKLFTNNNERMRITAGGNYELTNSVFSTSTDVTTTTYRQVYPSAYSIAQIAIRTDGYFYAGAISFRTADQYQANVLTERMRISSLGNVEIPTGSLKTSSPTGGTAQPWKFGEATNTLYTATRTVKVEINGALYYLLAVASSDL